MLLLYRECRRRSSDSGVAQGEGASDVGSFKTDYLHAGLCNRRVIEVEGVMEALQCANIGSENGATE